MMIVFIVCYWLFVLQLADGGEGLSLIAIEPGG